MFENSKNKGNNLYQNLRNDKCKMDDGRSNRGRGRGRGKGRAKSKAKSHVNGSVEQKLADLSITGLAASTSDSQRTKQGHPTLPKRPGFGSAGRKIRLSSNFFEVSLPNYDIFHYDVSVQPSSCPRYLNREIIEKMVAIYTDVFQAQKPAYDGRSNIYTVNPLPIGESKQKFNIEYKEEKDGRSRNFVVFVKFVARTSMMALADVLKRHTVQIPYETIQALDVAFRHLPSLRYISVGRSFFSPPDQETLYQLGNGREAWFGYHQSVRPGQWKMMINLDICSSAFYKAQPVVDFLCEVLNKDFRTRERRQLRDHERVMFSHEIKGLKICINYLGKQKRKYKVVAVTALSAANLVFSLEADGVKKDISVEKYFLEKYGIKLRYPYLSCLQVGNPSKGIFLPMEVCDVVSGQRCIKKLNDRQTSEMIKVTTRSAPERKQEIQAIVKKADFPNDPFVQYFGLKVNPEMASIEGRVLQPPQICYGDEKQKSNVQTVQPNNGVWDLRERSFHRAKAIERWALLLFVDSGKNNYDAVQKFIRDLVDVSERINMPFAREPVYFNFFNKNITDLDGIFKSVITECPNLQLVLNVLPGKSPIYAEIKKLGDKYYGVPTQCIQLRNVIKSSKQTLSNLLLKINAKMGGVSGYVPVHCKPRRIFETPVIFLGADVTHPSPGENSKPSIAAVVGSIDAFPMHYCTSIRVQKHRQELIAELSSMVRELLLAFYRCNGRRKPHRIIMYRDGVSDGQFSQVVQHEVSAIQEACRKLEKGYEPGITFITVQKRHHTRFFADQRSDQVGKARNVPPGTTVDTTICHPTEYDFYLCSHAGIQGTSRPAHYHVLWDDNDITPDELQQLTFLLCHTYVRCTRSVSIPAPAYYAHLAAFRARYHLTQKEGSTETGSSRSKSSDNDLALQSMADAVKLHENMIQTLYFA